MRKIILNIAVSLDGFIEGPNGDYEWSLTDQDYGMSKFFSTIDTIFIGRKSYESVAGMEDEYFPAIQKIYVFSDTLSPVDHEKVEVVNSTNLDTRVQSILSEEGANIWMFGGASLISAFINKKLIAEMVLSVHPILLGGGKLLFKDLTSMVDLLLVDTQTYDTGLVQLNYVLKPKFDYTLLDTTL